jgi:predicted nucleic acid-binding protein
MLKAGAVLLDTNIFLAALLPQDPAHILVRAALHELKAQRVVLQPVLGELFYLVHQRANYTKAQQVLTRLRRGAFVRLALTDDDLDRMTEIMLEYQDAEFDFVDLALMAAAERLNIRTLYTLDRRDFSLYRPRHCPYFDLLP